MCVPGHHLLLGGSGFIGRHVAAALLKRGERVVIASRSKPTLDLPSDVLDRVSWRHFELAQADWPSLIEGTAVIHHYAWTSVPASAASHPAEDLVANLGPTIELLEALRRRGQSDAPRLLFTSSGGTVYGRLRQVPAFEDHALSPLNAYGAAKAAAEHYIGSYRATYGLDCRIARVANPFGAGQNLARGQGAVTTFLERALTYQPIEIWGTGDVVRDFLHVSDVAAGLVDLAMSPLPDGPWVYNFGSGQGICLREIVSEIQAQLGRRLEVIYLTARAFDMPISILDITLAASSLGWAPRLSFSAAIRQTLQDLQNGLSLSSQT